MSDERFPWVEDVTAPAVGGAGHIDNIQIAQLMYDAWMRYLLEGVGLPRAIFDTGGRPTVREITARFDAEIFPGDALECGVRALARSRRSFTLRQVLRRKDTGAHVASGTVVLVTIDPTTWQPVEIPAAIWDEIERAEGKSIPTTAR
jgi:acyl-CoA thioesterase FadM